MKRTINFTGKKKLPRKYVDLDVTEEGGEIKVFYSIDTTKIDDLVDLGLVIQADYRGELDRYEIDDLCGQEEDGSLDGIYYLEDLYLESDQSGSLQFNIYFVNGNTIRRYCEKISVSRSSERETILPVITGDTGRQFWEIDYNDYQEGPVLVLNKKIDSVSSTNIKNEARTPEFIFKTYPAIIRQVLERMVFQLEVSSKESASSDWVKNWFRFAEIHSEETPDLDPDTRDDDKISDWIEEVSRNFLAKQTGAWLSLINSRRGSR